MLLKAKQIDFDTLVSNFITYLNSHPSSKQYFYDLANHIVETTPTPSYITVVNTSNITNTTVDLSWTAITGAVTYEVEVTEYGNSISLRRITGITSASYTVTGLNPSMTYEIKVRALL